MHTINNNTTVQSFDIRNHIDKLKPSSKKERYECPVCEGENLTINDDTGAYQCWNGCECADIRNAIAPLDEKRRGTPLRNKSTQKPKRKYKPVSIPGGARVIQSESLGDKPEVTRGNFPRPKKVPEGATRTKYIYSPNQWVYRYDPPTTDVKKQFTPVNNFSGKEEWKKGTEQWDAYRLDEAIGFLLEAENPALLWLEGEKCVEIARAVGIVACTFNGSSWSRKEMESSLHKVKTADPLGVQIFLADSDGAGEKKAETFQELCKELKIPCVIVSTSVFEVNGDIEQILDSMDVPEFIKKLEEELHAAALNSTVADDAEEEDEEPKTGGEKDFIYNTVRYLFGGDNWICVDDRLYKYENNYYSEVADEILVYRIQNYCFNYPVVDKNGETTHPFAGTRTTNEVLAVQKNLVRISADRVNPPGINCTNGIVKVVWVGKTPNYQLVDHSPEQFYTYPGLVKYDPKADPTQCERLLRCLNPAQQQVFLRNVAASIDLPTIRKIRGREVKALLLSGLGSNGKDALREVVSTIWGHEGMTSCSLADFAAYDDGKKFPLSALRKSRINWASENPQTARLDKIQSLKLFVTGNKLHSERKGKDHVEFTPQATGLFNVNDIPSLQGTMQAIVDRLGVLTFTKTFKKNPDPNNPNELLADPRFAYDDEFIRNEVASAFLNKLLQALIDLCREGIDYSCTEEAFSDMQKRNNHLFQFCDDVGLIESSEEVITVSQLWEILERWYIDQGTLTVHENGKREWVEQARPSDKNVKASHQVCERFRAIFPSAKRIEVPHPIHGAKKSIPALKGVAIAIDNRTPFNENSTPSAPPISTPSNPVIEGIAPPAPPITLIAEEKIKNKVNEVVNMEVETENYNTSSQSKQVEKTIKEEEPTQVGGAGGATPTITDSKGVQVGGAKGVQFSTEGVRLSTNGETNHIKPGITVYPLSGKFEGKECVVSCVGESRIHVYPVSQKWTTGNYEANQLSFTAPVQKVEEEASTHNQGDLFDYGYNYSNEWEDGEFLEEIDD